MKLLFLVFSTLVVADSMSLAICQSESKTRLMLQEAFPDWNGDIESLTTDLGENDYYIFKSVKWPRCIAKDKQCLLQKLQTVDKRQFANNYHLNKDGFRIKPEFEDALREFNDNDFKIDIANLSFVTERVMDHVVNFVDCFEINGLYNLIVERLDFNLSALTTKYQKGSGPESMNPSFPEIPPGVQFLYMKSLLENVAAFHKAKFIHNDIKLESFEVQLTYDKESKESVKPIIDIRTKLTNFDMAIELHKVILNEDKVLTHLLNEDKVFTHPIKVLAMLAAQKKLNEEQLKDFIVRLDIYTITQGDAWSLGITFIYLLEPELESWKKLAQSHSFEDYNSALTSFHEKLEKDFFPRFKVLNLCSRSYLVVKTCVDDIIKALVNKKDSGVKNDVSELLEKMNAIHASNCDLIETDKAIYFKGKNAPKPEPCSKEKINAIKSGKPIKLIV
jgi:serine/threonine protein kinase